MLTDFNNTLAEININSSVINIGYELCNKFNLQTSGVDNEININGNKLNIKSDTSEINNTVNIESLLFSIVSKNFKINYLKQERKIMTVKVEKNE